MASFIQSRLITFSSQVQNSMSETERERFLLSRVQEQEAELRRLRDLLSQRHMADASPFREAASTGSQPWVAKGMKVTTVPSGVGAPAIMDHTTVAFDGRVIAFGGHFVGPKGSIVLPTNFVWSFGIRSGRWVLLECSGDTPSPRWGHSATLVGSKMLVFGGMKVSTSDTRTPLGKSKRRKGSPKRLEISGGDDTDTPNSAAQPIGSMYVLDLSSLVWSQVPPSSHGGVHPALAHHSAVAVGSHIYYFGGIGHNTKASNMIRCFDTESKMWQQEEPYNWQLAKVTEEGGDDGRQIPTPRYGHSCGLSGDKASLVVFGGMLAGSHSSNEVFMYNLQRKQWSCMVCSGPGPAPRHNHAATVFGDSLFVFGGCDSNGIQFTDLFRLDLITFEWSEMHFAEHTKAPYGAMGRSMAVDMGATGTVYLFGGVCSAKSKVLSDVWRLCIGKEGAPTTERREPSPSGKRLPGPPRCATATSRHVPRPPTADGLLPSPRSGMTASMSPSRPFTSQSPRRLSMQYFSTFMSSDSIPAVKKVLPPAEIKRIVDRLGDKRPHLECIKELEKKYLFSPKSRHLSEEDEEASVKRLYYEEVEGREERMAELDQLYYPPLEPTDLTEDDVYDSVERLYSARKMQNARQEEDPSVSVLEDEAPPSNRKSPLAPLLPKEQAAVNRLYYQQVERSRETRQKLEERYLWNPIDSGRRK